MFTIRTYFNLVLFFLLDKKLPLPNFELAGFKKCNDNKSTRLVRVEVAL